MFNALKKIAASLGGADAQTGSYQKVLPDSPMSQERAAFLSRIESMGQVKNLRRGLHTDFRIHGIKDPGTFAVSLMAALDTVREPDYPDFGIVGFGLVARVVADSRDSLHIDIQLSSTKCSHEKAIVAEVRKQALSVLSQPGAPKFSSAPKVTVLPPTDVSRGRQWGPHYMDPDVKVAFVALNQQMVFLVAAGYLPQGSTPDSIYLSGVKLYQQFKVDREKYSQIVEAANGFLAQLSKKMPSLANLNTALIAQNNRKSMDHVKVPE